LSLFTKWASPAAKTKRNKDLANNSTHSLPTTSTSAPGLSVLENAAKLQQQWHNSYSNPGDNDIETGSGAKRSSLPAYLVNHGTPSNIDADRSLHEIWTTSPKQQTNETLPAKKSPRQRSFVEDGLTSISSTADASSPPSPDFLSEEAPPRAPPTSKASSLGTILFSGRTQGSDGSNDNRRASLTEEEEFAYQRDYGSFDDLPEHDMTDTADERDSLLDYESTDRRASNYMSFEKSTQDLEY
jgi:hypothetical protein